MTGETGIVLISIAHDALVFLIRLRIQVTGNTGKFSEVGGIFMAIQAFAPGILVLAGIYWKKKTVVVECGGRP